jgi:hypothetical protein
VYSGIFDLYPALKIVTHHLGGMIPITMAESGLEWPFWAAARKARITALS